MRIERNIAETSSHSWTRWTLDFGDCQTRKYDKPATRTGVNRYDQFVRSNIVHNKPDSSGFRAPSAYRSYEYKEEPPIGESQIEELERRNRCGAAGWGWKANPVALDYSYIFGRTVTRPPPFNTRSTNSLKIQCLRGVKDQKVNLAMTLAFTGETARMVRDKGKFALDLLKAMKRRDWRSVARMLKISRKSTASFYLEVLFGWRQLMADIHGIIEACIAEGKLKEQLVYGRAKHKSSQSFALSSQPYHNVIVGNYVLTGDKATEQSAVMIFKVTSSAKALQAELGLMNPAELLYDLIPWSWVASFFMSIGDYLSTLDASAGMRYMGGSLTTRVTSSGIVTVEPMERNGYKYIPEMSPGMFSWRETDRIVLTDDVDPLELKNPFQGPLAIAAAIMAAVAQQANQPGAKNIRVPRGPTRRVLRNRYLPPINYE